MTLKAVPSPKTARQTHFERLMVLARAEFDEGRWMRGLENVAHAGFTEDRPDEATRLRLVREVLSVEWTPDGDAAA